MYTPLGIKTDYSLLKSLIKIEDLILYAKENGYTSLGILDDNLCGSHTFIKACNKNNIKGIVGLDIMISDHRLFLYPKNMDGLENLFKLTRRKIDEDIELSSLSEYSDNVICVLNKENYSLYKDMQVIFKDVFLSFKDELEKSVALKITDRVVYIDDILFLNQDDAKYINYLYMIDHNLKLGDMELVDYRNNILKKRDYDTSALTDLIDIKFNTDKRYIPHYDDNIEDSEVYLRSLALKGLNKRLNNKVPSKYLDRLNYELDVIASMGFTDYFLIVFDYVRFAVKNDIYVGAGRGSAAGSLVAYSLGITWIDPLKYDLLFERFLNPERVTMPDIDIDFEDERRDEVVDYVRHRYGEEKVAKIMTYGTMAAKEVIRLVGKINNIDETALNSLLKLVNPKVSLKDNMTDEVKALLKRNSLLNKVYEEARHLEGLKKHISTHAAGVIISSEDLDNIIPIIKSGDDYLTGYTKDELEELGLLKMDFLSIKNLTILTNIIKMIEKDVKHKININNIPLDDPLVYELFAKANTVGIFQFESTGLKNFLKRSKPRAFNDLVMAIAIYRPGPMQSIDTYLDRKNGGKKVIYDDPSLEPILKETYGILIYQEQIMEILRLMAKYSYAEADIIRRAISKKKHDVIENERVKFVSRSIDNGYSEEVANRVFDLIARFAEFGFNKSHSVAYAMIAYQMAYLKTYYKEYFYINLLNNNIGSESKSKEYIEEAKKYGISILKPSVNHSDYGYVKEGNAIRTPLRAIKGVGLAGSDAIISERKDEPFTDYFDFLGRCYGRSVNKKILETLIYAGVFDEFGYNRATLLRNMSSSMTYALLLQDLDASLVNKPEFINADELSEIELMEKEKELFGYYISTHPASKYPDVMKQIDIEKYYNKYVETVILVEKLKKLKTKNNDEMAFITGSDETISNDFVIFPTYIHLLDNIKVGDLIKVSGKVEKRYDKYQIIVSKVEKV